MSTYLTPLELLEEELDKWEVSLQKSKDAFVSDSIPKQVHEGHVSNLEPKIMEYKLAIKILINRS